MVPVSEMPHVVVVGAGFGGVSASSELAKEGFRVTLIDRHPYNTFQPLLYQVATAGLNPSDIAHPIRSILAVRLMVFPARGYGASWILAGGSISCSPASGGAACQNISLQRPSLKRSWSRSGSRTIPRPVKDSSSTQHTGETAR